MVRVERSYPAPKSLETESTKPNGSYNQKDVTERLKRDFHDKCYICELKGLQDPEVEHLLPHKNGKYPQRKFDWDNLFWCCGHCNRIKNSGKYDAGIVDCCRQDPEKLLKFTLEEDDVNVTAINPLDSQAQLTARLVYETFNLKNTGIREAACENRLRSLCKSMDVLYRELDNYKRFPMSPRNKRMMSSLLSRSSSFAAFKRGYVRDHSEEYPELQSILERDNN